MTPVATPEPSFLIRVLTVLGSPGTRLTTFEKFKAGIASKITLPLNLKGILSVRSLVSPSSCSATLKYLIFRDPLYSFPTRVLFEIFIGK